MAKTYTPEGLASLRAACHRRRKPPAERFWPKVQKTRGCWLWTGAKTIEGYGRFFLEEGKSPLQAHRAACDFMGIEIPAGLVVDHLCRNRTCVNPAHFRFVTPSVNSSENNTSPFAINRNRTHCKHGHAYTPENLAVRVIWGPKTNKILTRICLTCRPSEWRYAVVKRLPPAGSNVQWTGPQTLEDTPTRKPVKRPDKRRYTRYQAQQ